MATKGKLNLDLLLSKIVALMVQHNPSTLTFSKVARFSGVPRATLYYYFGNSAEKMLEEAVRFGVRAFVQLGRFPRDLEFETWDELQLERMRRSVVLVQRYPWIPALYFKYRGYPGPIGDRVREVEDEYSRRFAKTWLKYHGTSLTPEHIRILSAIKIGLLFGLATDGSTWFEGTPETRALQLVRQMNPVFAQFLKLTSFE